MSTKQPFALRQLMLNVSFKRNIGLFRYQNKNRIFEFNDRELYDYHHLQPFTRRGTKFSTSFRKVALAKAPHNILPLQNPQNYVVEKDEKGL